jgi:methylated-DNA-[protein]-cysteine S-methyltransferase
MTSAGSGLFQAIITHPLTDLTVHARYERASIIITGISFRKPGSHVRELVRDKRFNGVIQVLLSILDGYAADTNNVSLDYSWCTPFQEKVMTAARGIPWGTTVSYAQLAQMAGYPRAIRAAASVMRNNRFPLIIPCHRVIRSDGTIGGFMGSAHGWTITLKRKLLENERKAAHLQVNAGQCPAGAARTTANVPMVLCR